MAIQTQDALISLIKQRSQILLNGQEDERAIDWNARREQWLKKIDELYGFIKPLLQNAGVTLSEESIEIHEEMLGAYVTQKLKAKIGLRCFELKPVASVIIGGLGRIDVHGPCGSARFILTTPDGESEHDDFDKVDWYVTAPRRHLPLEKLDAVCFLGLFAQLMGLEE